MTQPNANAPMQIDPLEIENPLDPRVADYVGIRERDLLGRGGRFIAEGAVVLRGLLASPWHQTESILIAARHEARIRDMLFGAGKPHVPVMMASQAVLNAIAGFDLHRGILALGMRGPMPDLKAALAALPGRTRVLGLFGISNHDNMGGLLRNAAAFGVDLVVLDSRCCDPFYRKALRVSVGAALGLPLAWADSEAEALAAFEAHGLTAMALSPSGRYVLSDYPVPDRVAALFGAEGPGLATETLRCADSVAIPMRGGFDSLNVATTSGIVLHHLAQHQDKKRG
ncbi:MAG: TrmH family RNA methyltransferase [Asticcacaulis sp.]